MTDWMLNQAAECDPNWPEKRNAPPPPRFFLAHRKAADDAELDELVTICSALIDRLSHGKPFDLVLGRTYYEARFKACGSWDAWTAEVATGIDYLTRKPIFDAIMVPAAPVGAGTAAMVRKATEGRRPVYACDVNGQTGYAIVVGVRTVDAKDWQGGYRLVCKTALG